PCRRVSGDGMRVEPSLMHHEGGSWTAVRTHTPSKLSKVQSTFVSHPLGLLQVSGERITAPSEPDGILVASSGSPVSLSLWPWPITLASVLDNVQDRFGCSHLAYLCVLYIGNLPHFALGLLSLLCARVDGFPVLRLLLRLRHHRALAPSAISRFTILVR